MLFAELLSKTGMTIEELTPVLRTARYKGDLFPESDIPDKIAANVLAATSRLSTPALPASTYEAYQEEAPITTVEPDDKKAIATFAQANQMTQTLVNSTLQALEQKALRITLEAAYLRRRGEYQTQDAETLGTAIADLERAEQRNQQLTGNLERLRQVTEQPDQLTQDVFGANLNDVLNATERRLTNINQANEEQTVIINLLAQGKSIDDIRTMLGKPQLQCTAYHKRMSNLKSTLLS